MTKLKCSAPAAGYYIAAQGWDDFAQSGTALRGSTAVTLASGGNLALVAVGQAVSGMGLNSGTVVSGIR